SCRPSRLARGDSRSSAPRSSTAAAAFLTLHAAGFGMAQLSERDCARIALSQLSSSTSRTTARAEVLSPVGRLGVARKTRLRSAIAASDAVTAAWYSGADFTSIPARCSETDRYSLAAMARQAAAALPRRGSLAGAGHSSE